MAKNDQQEAYAKALTDSLARVLDLVKFAEAKNGAMLAFCSAWLVAIGNASAKPGGVPGSYVTILPIAATLLLVAALIAVFSFLPRVNLSRFFKGEAAVSRPLNLVFYGDIRHVDISAFPARVEERYLPRTGQSATDDYLSDLACQLHVNSSIASRKYALFKVAGWLLLVALALLAWPAVRWGLVALAKLIAGT